jgi:hypothetical protein
MRASTTALQRSYTPRGLVAHRHHVEGPGGGGVLLEAAFAQVPAANLRPNGWTDMRARRCCNADHIPLDFRAGRAHGRREFDNVDKRCGHLQVVDGAPVGERPVGSRDGDLMATVRPNAGTPFEQALQRLEAQGSARPRGDAATPNGSPPAPPVASRGRLVYVPVRVGLRIDEAAWLERHGGSADDLADAVRRYVPEALRESSAARAGLIVSARRDRL